MEDINEINIQAFRCEMRSIPVPKIKLTKEKLENFSSLPPTEQADLAALMYLGEGVTADKKKAIEIYEIAKEPVIADDSGLCVDGLNGEPGVYSARYAGEPCNDENNNDKLLAVLKEKNLLSEKERNAHFISVVVLVYPDGSYKYGEGRVEGTILHERRGNGGFGYDPLFYSYELKKTFAEINLDEKNTVSHRARALEDLLKKL